MTEETGVYEAPKFDLPPPTIGRIVIVRDPSRPSNGSIDQPAIINGVWSPTCINATVFPDCGTPHSRTSLVRINPTDANAVGWFWPTRV